MSSSFLPRVCARARTEIVINLVLFAVTMGAFALFFVENYLNNRDVLIRFLPGSGAERIVYNLIFAVFMFGSFTYQVSRLSFFLNVRKRTRAAQESLARFLSRKNAAPRVEIVVPSYREESHVIWQTLMSAALVDYPNRGIVLLLDNPPNPTNRADRDLLLSSWAQVDLINDMLAPVAAQFAASADEFRAQASANVDLPAAAAMTTPARSLSAIFCVSLHRHTARGHRTCASRRRPMSSSHPSSTRLRPCSRRGSRCSSARPTPTSRTCPPRRRISIRTSRSWGAGSRPGLAPRGWSSSKRMRAPPHPS